MANALHIQEQLKRSIQNHHLSHAFLFAGEQGTGKERTALWLAQRLFCLQPTSDGDPCQECVNCKRISQHEFPDVIEIKPEGTGIKTSQIQAVQQEFTRSALESSKKLFIIHQAETMNESASNRLLKFIEEPVGDTTALLLTQNESLILPTIRSRCQIIRFTASISAIESLSATEQIVYQLTNDGSKREDLLSDDAFLEQLDLINQWWELLVKRDLLAFIFVQQHLMKKFTARAKSFDDRSAKARLFDIIMIKAKQALKQSKQPIYFTLFEQAIEAKKKLNANVNFQAVCEQFAWLVLR